MPSRLRVTIWDDVLFGVALRAGCSIKKRQNTDGENRLDWLYLRSGTRSKVRRPHSVRTFQGPGYTRALFVCGKIAISVASAAAGGGSRFQIKEHRMAHAQQAEQATGLDWKSVVARYQRPDTRRAVTQIATTLVPLAALL